MIEIHFNEDEALRQFDRLVALGIIKYAETPPFVLNDEGFPFTIRVCDGWKKKPAVVGAVASDAGQADVMFGPGSDIINSHPDQTVGQLNGTHIVALNIYPAFRPQYLLLTLDSSRSQYEPLHLEDISASWASLHSLETPHIALYNCTPEAGCSRIHKHVQVIPYPDDAAGPNGTGSFRLFPDHSDGNVHVPYTYFLHRFHSESLRRKPSAREVFSIYTELLAKTRQCLGIASENPAVPCPHNVVLVKDWILVIPRQPRGKPSLMTNGAGMMGIIITSTADQAKQWIEKGVSAALAECGVSSHVTEN